MIVNAFVFLYLKLTRNSWNKELKRNYIYVLLAGREVRIGKTKNFARGTQFSEHNNRQIAYSNLFPTHDIFR